MGRDDWYRNAIWNLDVEQEFFAKLKRARAHKQGQYLRIQAATLAKRDPHTALMLLEKYFERGDQWDAALAYDIAATAFLALDKLSDALNSYEAAMAREKEFPQVQTHVPVEYCYLVAIKKISSKYRDTLEVLDDMERCGPFPVSQYKWNAANALINADLGNHHDARQAARLAIEFYAMKNSGFQNHPDLGLVTNDQIDLEAHEILLRIADSDVKK